ncbi:hypothetical protein UCRPA7_8405 [Phaeoacremonium minimum UCRPA7]|uniref:HNH nuclease domain-containing protein n=1 Tax=Phaeoacremonium minimum (strain UCR-PA7) TaxID=1286976 RepID=R8B9V4_PHAM7|nr:hypothetical protein UCRPA7_8405 [Phaeoacremonium minimum UCRPA7]EON96099.1 hypothetical protein UCRPA7_8405 [Phaeoacremonium minimum UCRPA7]
MSDDTILMDTGLPEGGLPAMALLPPGLASARSAHDEARRISTELRVAFEALSREVEPEVEPNEEEGEPDPKAARQLALLGVELASREKNALELERTVIAEERDSGIINGKTATVRLHDLNKRYLSAGDDLWRHQKKKIRSDDTGLVRLFDPRSNQVSECILAIYKKCDGLEKMPRRPSHWGADARKWYSGNGDEHGLEAQECTWCHISGQWHPKSDIEAARIVPFFPDVAEIGEILFGSKKESLIREGNSLLMSKLIKSWFDKYDLVIVPVDVNELPITRWKTELLNRHMRKCYYTASHMAEELDGKELVFLNDNRPVSRFVYFHFVMALIRIKDTKKDGWENVWARYYEQRPFPTPGPYMRRSMLLALATHFGAADMNVVESWIQDNGFESPLKLTEDETTEVARRVHETVEAAYARAEHLEDPDHGDPEDVSDDNSEQ